MGELRSNRHALDLSTYDSLLCLFIPVSNAIFGVSRFLDGQMYVIEGDVLKDITGFALQFI